MSTITVDRRALIELVEAAEEYACDVHGERCCGCNGSENGCPNMDIRIVKMRYVLASTQDKSNTAAVERDDPH